MDENSKLIQPSDITVQSYQSQSVSNQLQDQSNDASGLSDKKASSYEKLNNFLLKDMSPLKDVESSLENTQVMLEDQLKDEDNKIFKQLDDLRFGSLSRKLANVKQEST